jgi:hypothetical protein
VVLSIAFSSIFPKQKGGCKANIFSKHCPQLKRPNKVKSVFQGQKEASWRPNILWGLLPFQRKFYPLPFNYVLRACCGSHPFTW